jgi:flagellar protein FliO/FliZ
MSPEMIKYAWMAGGFFAVLVGAWILWAVLKKVMSNGGPNLFSGRDRRRLGLVEWTSIGGGRQLLLVRRDNIEHLILTGGPLDVVVESGIGKEPPSPSPAPAPVEVSYQAAPRSRLDLGRFEQADFNESNGSEAPASRDLPAVRSADLKRENGSRRSADSAEVVDGAILMGFSGGDSSDGASHKAASESKE